MHAITGLNGRKENGPVTITKDNFDQEAMKSRKPILLDFWASWCIPCRMMGPVIEKVANERTNAVVGKVNVDEEPELAQRFGVMGIPTLIVVKDGKVINQSTGARPKAAVLSLLN